MAEKPEFGKGVTIDGVNYNFSELSENAKKLLINVRIADQEIVRLNQQLALTQTARSTYAAALSKELPKKAKKEAKKDAAAE